MRRFISWLGRIPWWLWLFLVITQVGTLIAVPYRMSKLDHALLGMPDLPEYAQVREHFEKSWRDEGFQSVSAAILAPLFLGLGLWRWSASRQGRPGVTD